MEEVLNIIVTNGVGVGSFIAFLYFVKVFITKMNDTLNEISKTLVGINSSLVTLSSRVDDIENKLKTK